MVNKYDLVLQEWKNVVSKLALYINIFYKKSQNYYNLYIFVLLKLIFALNFIKRLVQYNLNIRLQLFISVTIFTEKNNLLGR